MVIFAIGHILSKDIVYNRDFIINKLDILEVLIDNNSIF